MSQYERLLALSNRCVLKGNRERVERPNSHLMCLAHFACESTSR
jgi:hypothetical protein